MYLALDTETGGLGLHTSLLSVALVEANDNFDLTGFGLNLNVMPDDGVFHVTAQGLSVNKIDLVEHVKTAKTYKEAGTILYKTLVALTNNGADKAILLGKNIAGDVNQVCDKLVKAATWDHFISYQWLDLSSAWRFCEMKGLVSKLEKTSLSNLCEYFDIPVENLHNAQADCILTIKCFKKLKELL